MEEQACIVMSSGSNMTSIIEICLQWTKVLLYITQICVSFSFLRIVDSSLSVFLLCFLCFIFETIK